MRSRQVSSSTSNAERRSPLVAPGLPRASTPLLSSILSTSGYCSGCRPVRSRASAAPAIRRNATALVHWASVSRPGSRKASRDSKGAAARRSMSLSAASLSKPGTRASIVFEARFTSQPMYATAAAIVSLSTRRALALLTSPSSYPSPKWRASTLSNSAMGSCRRRARLTAARWGTL